MLAIEDDGEGLERSAPAIERGMGLHIMRYRANMIGGSLEVDRAANAAAPRSLPVSHADHANEGVMTAQMPSATTDAKHRVFIVDDHPIVRQGLALLINVSRT